MIFFQIPYEDEKGKEMIPGDSAYRDAELQLNNKIINGEDLSLALYNIKQHFNGENTNLLLKNNKATPTKHTF